MKFSDYLTIKESLRDSIDDSDVLNVLSKYSIYNDRIKLDGNELLYKFDNRYSLTYDGEVFTLYRHGDRIHFEYARNLQEIDDVISKWLASYSLDSIEISDDDIVAQELIDKISNSNDAKIEEPDSSDDTNTDDENDDEDEKK